MPATRRSSSGPRTSAAGGRQATLSFHNRVTKSVPKSGKNLVSSAGAAKNSPLSKGVSLAKEESITAEEDEPPFEKDNFEAAEEPATEKSEAELRAEKISDRQIDQYWCKLEMERKAKRVHQADLSVGEKVLRYFDVNAQYGPCVGINRIRRWQRADRLGLNPPTEVLAVLLKQESKDVKSFERAHMDEILNSTAVGAI